MMHLFGSARLGSGGKAPLEFVCHRFTKYNLKKMAANGESKVDTERVRDDLEDPRPTKKFKGDGNHVSSDSENVKASQVNGLTEINETNQQMPGPQLTKPAPDFSGTAIVNGEIKEIKASDYKGKYVVLFFYPLDFTFVCPTEIIAFSDRANEFRKINCEVIAASCDSHFSHLAWVNTPRKQGGLGSTDIPLLADKSGKIAKAYGVYNEETGIPFRGLFIIDGKQNLRQITVNDLPVGRSVDETLRLVNAFQFTDQHGEVCPANWKPGEKSMKPDPVGSKSYFNAVN